MGMEMLKRLRDDTGAGILACQKALKETNNNYDEAVDLLRKQGIAKASSKADRATGDGLCVVAKNESGVVVVKLNCETDFVAKNEKFQSLAENIANVALDNGSGSIDELLNQSFDGKTVTDYIKENIATIGENIVLGDVKFYRLEQNQRADYYVHNQVEGNNKEGKIVSVIISSGCDNEDSLLLLKQLNMHITAMFPLALSDDKIPHEIVEREKAIYEEQVAQLNKPADIAIKMVEGKMRKFFEEKVLLKQMFVLDNKKSVAEVINDFNKANNCKLEIIDFIRMSIN